MSTFFLLLTRVGRADSPNPSSPFRIFCPEKRTHAEFSSNLLSIRGNYRGIYATRGNDPVAGEIGWTILEFNQPITGWCQAPFLLRWFLRLLHRKRLRLLLSQYSGAFWVQNPSRIRVDGLCSF